MPSPFAAYRGSSAASSTAQQWQNSRGGELFAQGISKAGEAIAEGIKRMGEETKRTKAMRALIKSYAKETGDEALAAQADGLSGPQAQGLIESWGYAQTAKKLQADLAQQRAATRMTETQTTGLEADNTLMAPIRRQLAEAQVTGAQNENSMFPLRQEMLQENLSGLQDERTLTNPLRRQFMQGQIDTQQWENQFYNPVRLDLANEQVGTARRANEQVDKASEALMNAGRGMRRGMAGDEALTQAALRLGSMDALNAANKWRDEGLGNTEPKIKDFDGQKVVFSPKTGAFQVLQTNENAQVVKTEDGRVLGYRVGNSVVQDPLVGARIEALTMRMKNANDMMKTWGERSTAGKAAREEYQKLEQQLIEALYPGPVQPQAGGGDWQDLGNGYRFQTLR